MTYLSDLVTYINNLFHWTATISTLLQRTTCGIIRTTWFVIWALVFRNQWTKPENFRFQCLINPVFLSRWSKKPPCFWQNFHHYFDCEIEFKCEMIMHMVNKCWNYRCDLTWGWAGSVFPDVTSLQLWRSLSHSWPAEQQCSLSAQHTAYNANLKLKRYSTEHCKYNKCITNEFIKIQRGPLFNIVTLTTWKSSYINIKYY